METVDGVVVIGICGAEGEGVIVVRLYVGVWYRDLVVERFFGGVDGNGYCFSYVEVDYYFADWLPVNVRGVRD